MDYSAVINALQLVLSVCVPALAAIGIGAIITGVLQTVTQIQDPVLGLAGRIGGAAAFLMILGTRYSSDVVSFAIRIWGGGDFYR